MSLGIYNVLKYACNIHWILQIFKKKISYLFEPSNTLDELS
jgi:hypothetical protein